MTHATRRESKVWQKVGTNKIRRAFVMRRLKFRYLTIAGLLFTLSSCESDSKIENPAHDLGSAASYISQADQMYAQREDLARLQQGIVFLRQAAVADPNSYRLPGDSLSSIIIWRHISMPMYATKDFELGSR